VKSITDLWSIFGFFSFKQSISCSWLWLDLPMLFESWWSWLQPRWGYVTAILEFNITVHHDTSCWYAAAAIWTKFQCLWWAQTGLLRKDCGQPVLKLLNAASLPASLNRLLDDVPQGFVQCLSSIFLRIGNALNAYKTATDNVPTLLGLVSQDYRESL
jgi:hypothetical protein